MADDKENKENKEKLPKDQPPAPAKEESVSLDDIDKLLAEEDPEFANAVSNLGNELQNADLEALEREMELKEKNPLKKFFYFLKRNGKELFYWFIDISKRFLVYLATDGRKKFVAFVVASAKYIHEQIRRLLHWYDYLTTEKKLQLLGLILFVGGSGYLIKFTFTQGLVPPERDPFLSSLALSADQVYEFDNINGKESFYNSPRLTQNTVLLEKLIVNLKPEKGSRSNPMGIFELYIECSNQEVAIEIKDKNLAIKDLVQRVLEGFTYNTLDTIEGKDEMRDKMRKELNTLLTMGQARKIMIKNIILKP